MTARYITVEGTEGVGKTTQTQKLVDHLRAKGYKVLQTKEPGTSHSPLTMELRNIMLNAKYEPEMTIAARELVSQAIRSIHIEKVILPAMEEYDYIIQDRGTLSGLAYGTACGMHIVDLFSLSRIAIPDSIQGNKVYNIYDSVIYLTGDTAASLEKAKTAKQEFEAGDAIEARGASFMEQVNINMDNYSKEFRTHKIDIIGKNIEQVFSEILHSLDIEE